MEKQQLALGIIRDLCESLENEEIAYCHWKSNAALDRSASGDNDLDLLVSRSDVTRFTEILCRLDFKGAYPPAKQQLPGVLDYYGYDRKGDKLIHVHAHYQLVLGHDATKNHRLSIERPFLESVIQEGLFKIPAPEFELIVFVMRMILKHSTWDAILGRQGALSKTERQEIAYLQSRADQSKTYAILKQHMPYIDAALFDRCMQSLGSDYPIWTRIKVGQQLQKRLQANARRSQILDTFLKLWRQFSGAVQRRAFENRLKKRIVSGGAMIAVVGGDGAGKSTAIGELNKWLSKNFMTMQVHMGRPKMSLFTIIVRGILKIGRLLGLYQYSNVSNLDKLESSPHIFPGYPSLIRDICTARDRYLTYLKARRFTADGGLVICDRFPLPQIQFMDGPQVKRKTSNYLKYPLIEYLTNLETKYYLPIKQPEILIVLKVDPEIAVQRKVEEEPSLVRGRSKEIWDLDWQRTQAHIIDANCAKEEVLSELKYLVWSEL